MPLAAIMEGPRAFSEETRENFPAVSRDSSGVRQGVQTVSNVWCVRAEFGTYTKYFVEGGYVAIGFVRNTDLSGIRAREELYPLYRAEHPDETSNIVIGQQVGQVARSLLEIELVII